MCGWEGGGAACVFVVGGRTERARERGRGGAPGCKGWEKGGGALCLGSALSVPRGRRRVVRGETHTEADAWMVL